MPVFQVLMLAIMFLALMVEVKTGGAGAGVILGLVAAGVFWGGQYANGSAELYELGLFLGGILCIIAEMLLPTIGLLAGAGVAMLLYSVAMSLGGDLGAVGAMAVALGAALFVFLLIVQHLPSSRLWNRIVLREQTSTSDGYVSAVPRDELVGRTGIVLTELRPAGSARIDGKSVDVVSEGRFVPKGTSVEVVSVQGNRVVVRALPQLNQ